MDTIISQKERQEVFAWLRGGDITPDPNMEEKFLQIITVLVEQRLSNDSSMRVRRLYQDKPHPCSLKAIMLEVDKEEAKKAETEVQTKEQTVDAQKDDNFLEAEVAENIDSLLVGGTLLYASKEKNHSINMTQIQAMMYIIYGIYLAQKGKRLVDEHPQMWEYGPVFPRVYNKLRKSLSDGQEQSDRMKELHPAEWQFVRECFDRYAYMSGNVLVSAHVAPGSPWAAARHRSPDKWGAVIDDDDISKWFEKRM